MRAGSAVVPEFLAGRLPGLAAVVRALDLLSEPAGGLGRIDPVGIGRRPLEVIHLPAGEEGAVHGPLVALAVGGEDERALPGADQYPHSAHRLPSRLSVMTLATCVVVAVPPRSGVRAPAASARFT